MRGNLFQKLFFISVLFLETVPMTFAQILYEVTPVEFNTREYDEFAPVAYGNGLILNTCRRQSLYKTEVDLNENHINDLYFVPKKSDGSWGELQNFSDRLNSRYHEGKAAFTADGNTVFFTRFGNDSTGNILKSTRTGKEWNNPAPVSFNSDEYRIKDPCLSADGKRLFFASRAPGGYGGYDIYVSSFERGDWGKPINLGPLVNTSGDEVAPFLHSNGKLFFSSNELPGLGGFDIFYSREIKDKWIAPARLPEPVNSGYDDLYYSSDRYDTTGYFSSNRNRSFDIFRFRFLWPDFQDCKPQQKNDYTYIFSEKGTVDNDTTTWLYEWDFGDGTKTRSKMAEAEHTFAEKGQYVIRLNVIDTLTGEILLNEDAFPFTVTNIEQPYIACPDTMIAGVSANFDASGTYLPDFKKIEYYYWDFGDGEKGTGLITGHSYSLPGKYVVRLCVEAARNGPAEVKRSCVRKEVTVKSSP